MLFRSLEGGGLRLTYAGAIDPGVRATVERSDDAAAWSALGTLTGSTGDVWIFDDATAAPGRRYAYRLALSNGETTEAAWVDVPVPAFGFAAVPPNPCRIGEAARFAVTGPATFTLLSANGRVLRREDVAGAVRLETAGLPAGVYWARLVRGDRSALRKVVLVR